MTSIVPSTDATGTEYIRWNWTATDQVPIDCRNDSSFRTSPTVCTASGSGSYNCMTSLRVGGTSAKKYVEDAVHHILVRGKHSSLGHRVFVEEY